MYNATILEHFENPRNVGSIEGADGFGEGTGTGKCEHDLSYFWIRVKRGHLVDVKQRTRGCPVAIAASSLTSELALGRTVDEALQITEQRVAEELGPMPERKFDSLVGPRALRAALADYLSKSVKGEAPGLQGLTEIA
jgi:nitrogen fixation NifU-like protein